MHAADLADAGEPGKRAGDRGGGEDDAVGADAGIGGRLRVLADRLDGEAERRAADQEPDDRRGEERQRARRDAAGVPGRIGKLGLGRIGGEIG